MNISTILCFIRLLHAIFLKISILDRHLRLGSGDCRSSPRRAVNVFLVAITSVNYLSCRRRRIVLVCLLRLLHFPVESWGDRWVEMNDRMDGWLSAWHLPLAAWSFNSVSAGYWRVGGKKHKEWSLALTTKILLKRILLFPSDCILLLGCFVLLRFPPNGSKWLKKDV